MPNVAAKLTAIKKDNEEKPTKGAKGKKTAAAPAEN
jgi:hypothetical protein